MRGGFKHRIGVGGRPNGPPYTEAEDFIIRRRFNAMKEGEYAAVIEAAIAAEIKRKVGHDRSVRSIRDRRMKLGLKRRSGRPASLWTEYKISAWLRGLPRDWRADVFDLADRIDAGEWKVPPRDVALSRARRAVGAFS